MYTRSLGHSVTRSAFSSKLRLFNLDGDKLKREVEDDILLYAFPSAVSSESSSTEEFPEAVTYVIDDGEDKEVTVRYPKDNPPKSLFNFVKFAFDKLTGRR